MKKKNKGCVRDWLREHQLNENVEIITNINSRTNTNNRINTNTNTNNNDHEHENQSIGESNYPKLLYYYFEVLWAGKQTQQVSAVLDNVHTTPT